MNIVSVPGINGLGKTNGCEKTGKIIFSYLEKLHSNEKGDPIETSKLNLEEINLDNSNIEDCLKRIYENAFAFFNEKERIFFIGGDHSISYPLTKSFFEHCQNIGKESCLIVFDAHPDLMTSMNEPTHEEWLRALIERGFPPENILIVGLRNSWKDEVDFIREKKIKTISVNEFNLDLDNACDTIMEFANGKELYVSLDIDVVDPVFAPATGYPEAGGLTSRQLIYFIQRLKKMKNFRAMDLVEINPEIDKNDITVKLGAKILGELL